MFTLLNTRIKYKTEFDIHDYSYLKCISLTLSKYVECWGTDLIKWSLLKNALKSFEKVMQVEIVSRKVENVTGSNLVNIS